MRVRVLHRQDLAPRFFVYNPAVARTQSGSFLLYTLSDLLVW